MIILLTVLAVMFAALTVRLAMIANPRQRWEIWAAAACVVVHWLWILG